jgi:hypothetical protein
VGAVSADLQAIKKGNGLVRWRERKGEKKGGEKERSEKRGFAVV